MQLKTKFLKWSTGVPVVMLNKKTAEELGIHSQDRISIKTLSSNPKEFATIVNVIERIVKKDEIAVSSELKHRLKLRFGQRVEIGLADAPKSLDLIKRKLAGKKLNKKEINIIIQDIVDNSLSESEVALFISAMYKNGMTKKETIFLIKAILKTGNTLSFNNKYVVDKHSIGGIPGNRTTPIVVSICAAEGLTMPKSSSRAITSAAGTADVIETIANVEFSIEQLEKIVNKTNACMVWGGALGMVPADSKIIRIEKMLKIDPEAQLLASIMSKKLASDSKYILIDIPYGEFAKVKKDKALDLKKKFESLGKYFKKKLKVVLTDGNNPIGNGVGPSLELIDVIKVLDPKQEGPRDLEKKSLYLSGEIFEMTGKAKKGKGKELAEGILDSGKAFQKFKQIIKAQGGHINGNTNSKNKKIAKIKDAEFKETIISNKKGKVISIDNKKIATLARVAGCPVDKLAGLYLHVKSNYEINKGDKIITIYAESKTRLKQAICFYQKEKPIKLGRNL